MSDTDGVVRTKILCEAQSGPRLTESIVDGLVRVYPRHLGRLDDAAFEAGVRVVVRKDFAECKDKVSVISGGGSGHEPAHAGFVGHGLLTAAVCGDVFASPTVKAVLSAVATVSSRDAGCLLVVKNYTGDRLNFGIAAETAKSRFGIRVETVYVKDDVALLGSSSQARGLAGCVLVHKVAGAAADLGWPLDRVARCARKMSDRCATMGAAFSACTLPGQNPTTNRVVPGTLEMGLGIHGEPGFEVIDALTAEALADRLVGACASRLGDEDEGVALIVNNLGGTSGLEMTIFGAAAIAACRKRELRVERLLEGPLVTSIDMHGVSVTLARIDEDLKALLDRACDSPYLKGFQRFDPSDDALLVAADPRALDDAPEEERNGGGREDARIGPAILAACRTLEENEPVLTEIDTAVGDGDCGTTLKEGALAVVEDLRKRPEKYSTTAGACAALGDVFGVSMGGSSGALYMLAARAAEKEFKQRPDCSWADAFVAAARSVSDHGGAGIGSRTMCDATLPAADVLAKGASLAEATKAARAGAESTKKLVATHGRSSYVAPERQSGVPDPGAVAVALIFEAIAEEVGPLS